jgi:superfamily II DNA or RNA helicase
MIRDYQAAQIEAILKWLATHGATTVVAPAGAGKAR